MSHKVYVLPDVARSKERLTESLAEVLAPSVLTPPADPFVELEDESADTLSHSGGALVAALTPTGPNAYFNQLQVPQLLTEIRAATNVSSRHIQRNLNEVADFIDKESRGGSFPRYVSFIGSN
jgi:hypothetical protein